MHPSLTCIVSNTPYRAELYRTVLYCAKCVVLYCLYLARSCNVWHAYNGLCNWHDDNGRTLLLQLMHVTLVARSQPPMLHVAICEGQA